MRDTPIEEEFERRARAGGGDYAIALGLFAVARSLDRLGIGNLSTDGAIKRLADAIDKLEKVAR
jgi:hypothetical protein